MIITVLTFLIGIVTSIVSFFGTLMITQNVSLLHVLIIWELIVIILWFLNKLGRGSGGRGVKKVDHDGN